VVEQNPEVVLEGEAHRADAQIYDGGKSEMAHGGRHAFWVDSLHDIQVASGVNNIVSLIPNIPATESRSGMTLLRTLICWNIQPTIHDSGEGQQTFDVGIGITSQDAFTAGAVADPEVETDHPMGGWLYRCRGTVFAFAADQAAVYSRILQEDLRGKRKLNNGNLFMTLTNTPEQGTATAISLIGITRCLFLST